jgi:catechol 2,3-dioxygenase-like lactoylglutathione lyase family enzyme
MTRIARFSLAALDCPDAPALADFYSRITGWEVDVREEGTWVELRSDGGATLAFQQVDGFEPPAWPDGSPGQQAHLDFDVDDLDAGERQILEIGARKADVQPEPEEWRVYLDPAGHPFCLVRSDD